MKKFKLELSAEKTHITPFSPSEAGAGSSFNFLGFEFRWGKDRAGKPHVDKRTARKSLRNSLTRFKLWLKENRHRRLPDLFRLLNTKLTGYFNHFGVHGNLQSLEFFYSQVIRQMWKYLNRRSQRKSIKWRGINRLLQRFQVRAPRIVEERGQRMPCQGEFSFCQRLIPWPLMHPKAHARAS